MFGANYFGQLILSVAALSGGSPPPAVYVTGVITSNPSVTFTASNISVTSTISNPIIVERNQQS